MELAKTTDTPGNASPVSALFAMFYEPGRAFSMLQPKRHAWLPLILLIASTAILMTWYFSVVDFTWLVDQMMATIKDAAQREQTKSVMTRNMMQIPGTFAAVAIVLLLLPKLTVLGRDGKAPAARPILLWGHRCALVTKGC